MPKISLLPEQLYARFPQREHLHHEVPPWVKNGAVFFLTIACSPRGANQLCRDGIAGRIFETAEFRVKRNDWFVHVLVLMPDHLHALVSFPTGTEIKKVISNWKEVVAKRCGVKWQANFFDHRLRSHESLEEKAFYMRMNPVRAGLVNRPEDWPYRWGN